MLSRHRRGRTGSTGGSLVLDIVGLSFRHAHDGIRQVLGGTLRGECLSRKAGQLLGRKWKLYVETLEWDIPSKTNSFIVSIMILILIIFVLVISHTR